MNGTEAIGLQWAWLAPAACVGAFTALALFGRYLPWKGPYIAIGAIGFGFVLFWFLLKDLLNGAAREFSATWFEAGGGVFDLGMTIDPVAMVMMGVITFVSLLVQIYSLGYMRGESRLAWYFAVHSLFVASMLGLVLSNNLLVLYVGWELVGICSYLLIGFWYERRSAAEAAKKAFITTRIGDVGLLVGILLLYNKLGTFHIPTILEAVEAGELSSGVLTLSAILIFLGAMGKSAQFPLHVWLPDAMEGPTPVSALIHAATMVVAGVYLVARMLPLFEAAPAVSELVIAIGLITAVMGATMALSSTDLKRVLAYSTVSQIGFMMLALGHGALAAAMFHLATHALFKALLFLGAGNVLHAVGEHSDVDIRRLGGLRSRMPVTSVVFVIAALALSGIPPLSGFWSKDEILQGIWKDGNPANPCHNHWSVLPQRPVHDPALLAGLLRQAETRERSRPRSPARDDCPNSLARHPDPCLRVHRPRLAGQRARPSGRGHGIRELRVGQGRQLPRTRRSGHYIFGRGPCWYSSGSCFVPTRNEAARGRRPRTGSGAYRGIPEVLPGRCLPVDYR